MRTRLLFALMLFVAIPGVGARAQSERVVDCIVAVVGSDIITRSEVEVQALQAAVQTKRSPNDPLLLNKVLEAMINDKLVLAQAELDSIVVAEDEVTQRLNMQLKYLERQYGSRERLEKAAGMPMAQIRREFRDDVRKRIMIERLQQQEFGNIEVSRREVEEFYNTYRDSLPLVPEMVELRQIVRYPKVTEDYKEQARRRAEALLDSLRAGADFKELARKYSEDLGSARNGGDLGLVRRGLLVKEFEEAAYALEPGEISNVVETKFGFHIIKMLERKGEAIHPLQILIKIKVTGSSDSLAINLLKDLRRRALEGESFADLATRYSEDKETQPYGGSLGLIETQQLSENLRRITQNLSPGEISAPVKITVRGQDAYMIVQVVRRISPHPMSLEKDYPQLERLAVRFKQDRMYRDWLQKIRKSVYWERRTDCLPEQKGG